MNGGVIKGNLAKNYGGGGVYIYGGYGDTYFNMKGGAIINNNAANGRGAGLETSSSRCIVEISGGIIDNPTANAYNIKPMALRLPTVTSELKFMNKLRTVLLPKADILRKM